MADDGNEVPDVAATLERVAARLDAIEASLQRIETSSRNMDRHISIVERFLFPFRLLGTSLNRLR